MTAAKQIARVEEMEETPPVEPAADEAVSGQHSASRDTAPLGRAEPDTKPSERSPRRWLTKGVGGVGASSFFSDSGHEITTSLLPTFLVSVLHSSVGVLGLIEGVSDALTGVAKILAGPMANDARLRGRLASSGYVGTALATGAIGLAVSPLQVGLLRAFAWTSRGVRSPARDSLLASVADRDSYGRAFGLERAGDNLGALAGPLLAAGLVGVIGIRPTMWLAAVPGLFAAISITVAVRAARTRRRPEGARRRLDFAALHRAGVVRALVPIVPFQLGNVATTLLILRATQLLHVDGRDLIAATTLAILIYAGHNAFGSLFALLGGHVLDHLGPRIVFGTGALLYVGAYADFAIGPHAWWLLGIGFILAGSGIGLAETAQSSLVASLTPPKLRGSGFGLLGAVEAAGAFASSAIVGLLYLSVGAPAGFSYAAAWMLCAVVAVVVLQTRPADPEKDPEDDPSR